MPLILSFLLVYKPHSHPTWTPSFHWPCHGSFVSSPPVNARASFYIKFLCARFVEIMFFTHFCASDFLLWGTPSFRWTIQGLQHSRRCTCPWLGVWRLASLAPSPPCLRWLCNGRHSWHKWHPARWELDRWRQAVESLEKTKLMKIPLSWWLLAPVRCSYPSWWLFSNCFKSSLLISVFFRQKVTDEDKCAGLKSQPRIPR